MSLKLPNFLIVGAARSGTTSLYYYLKQHPNIYLSPLKEPSFFVSSCLKSIREETKNKNHIITNNLEEYLSLFSEVKGEGAIGEASVFYLYYYKTAIENIKDLLGGDVKIIIILRNPAQRAFSNFKQMKNKGLEHLSFLEALKREDERRDDNWSPGFYYKDFGFYYRKVKAFKDNFENVKVCLFEDFKENPSKLLKDIFDFLEVDPSFKPDTQVKYNITGEPKSKFFDSFLNIFIKLSLSSHYTTNRLLKIKQDNLIKFRMNLEAKKYLKSLYENDIKKLQQIINKDISYWL